jgi:hypothetical protein
MNTMLEVVLSVVIAVWLCLSVLNQFRRGQLIKPVKRFDRASILPHWNLFAPTPAQTDYHLLYRDMSADGTAFLWREIEFRTQSVRRAVWHPERRIRKGLSLSIASLGRRTIAAKRFEKRRLLEVPYLLILNFVEQQPRDFRAVKRQFVIARTEGVGSHGNPRIVFLSAFHALPEA